MMVPLRNMTIVVAMDNNRVIGKDNDIPWAGCLRADMEHFKNYTMGKIVVMGRKTYESIPPKFRPLPGRVNVILTRNSGFQATGCLVVSEPNVMSGMSLEREVCIIGGAEIYQLFMPMATKILMTHVNARTDGNVFFPPVTGNWNLRRVLSQEIDERNKFSFAITEYTKISS